jgi:hypothetical protein
MLRIGMLNAAQNSADLGDYQGARRHRKIADELVSQLRNTGDVGRRLAETLRVERED